MKKFKKNISIFLCCILPFGFLGFTNLLIIMDQSQISNPNPTEVIANEELFLEFLGELEKPLLYIQSSYGSTILSSASHQKDHVKLRFNIPSFIAKKSGVISYQLMDGKTKILSDQIEILPASTTTSPLESYLGPPTIAAGGIDFSMMVNIPTDLFDNPKKDSTKVALKHQFLAIEKTDTLLTKNYIAWKNTFSYQKSGRILISSSSEGISSKEYTIDVYPSQAVDFSLFANPKHHYADGNQILEIYTSQIRDSFGNIISDGRMVEFNINRTKNVPLITRGTTINGIARAFLVHPDSPVEWSINAYIPEMAESNSLSLDFKAAVSVLPVVFSEDNRTITIGPILSFMGQIIPDGAIVNLELQTKNEDKVYFTSYSNKGKAVINISKDFYPNGNYTIRIKSMGITKTYNEVQLK